jgi:hypothetical protein
MEADTRRDLIGRYCFGRIGNAGHWI